MWSSFKRLNSYFHFIFTVFYLTCAITCISGQINFVVKFIYELVFYQLPFESFNFQFNISDSSCSQVELRSVEHDWMSAEHEWRRAGLVSLHRNQIRWCCFGANFSGCWLSTAKVTFCSLTCKMKVAGLQDSDVMFLMPFAPSVCFEMQIKFAHKLIGMPQESSQQGMFTVP